MDIGNVSMAMSGLNLSNKISFAVAKLAKEATETQGENLIEMLNESIIDISV